VVLPVWAVRVGPRQAVRIKVQSLDVRRCAESGRVPGLFAEVLGQPPFELLKPGFPGGCCGRRRWPRPLVATLGWLRSRFPV
jgi:hypothetical protein